MMRRLPGQSPFSLRLPSARRRGEVLLFVLYQICILTMIAGWGGSAFLGLTVFGVAVFVVLLVIRRRIKRARRLRPARLALGATAVAGVALAALWWTGVIQIPLMYQRHVIQRHDMDVVRDVFQKEPPSSFRLLKADWPGWRMIPSQAPHVAHYQARIKADQLDELFSAVRPFMKPPEEDDVMEVHEQTLLIELVGSLDRKHYQALEDRAGGYGEQPPGWVAYQIESDRKLGNIYYPSFVGCDEAASPTLTLYIMVHPRTSPL